MTLISLLVLASLLLFSAFVGLLHRFLQVPATNHVGYWGIGCALEQNLAPFEPFSSRAHRSVMLGFVHRDWLLGGRLQTCKAQALLIVNDRP
jgi:hypothetical protein